MSSKKKGAKTTKKSAPDYGGMDPKLMKALMDKIPPNAVTGRVDLGDIMKYMSQHPDDMDALLKSTEGLGLDDKDVDLSGYDFAALAPTIRHESFWCLQLEHMGVVDAAGRPIDDAKVHTTKGAQHVFMIYCYDDRQAFRINEECTGLPTAAQVLQALRRAIAKPLPPLKPELPWFLLLSIKFKQHVEHLQPFLDSLPAPFHWRVETPEEVETVKDGIWKLNEQGTRTALAAAEQQRTQGNAAFVKKDRGRALEAYSAAIDALVDVLSMTPDLEDEKDAKRQLAVCHANRAAAYLIAGPGVDPKKAIEDGKTALHWDPGYAKAYIRQATAYQLMGDREMAKDVVAEALRKPGLEDDAGLVTRLIELYTDGKGLSNDEATFKNWLLDVMINDRRSSERLLDMGGEWRRRLDAQFAKWKRS